MNKFKAVFIIFLFFNLFFHVFDWSDTKVIFSDFISENEYKKIKVLVDSVEKDRRILVKSGSDIIIYRAYYTSPKGNIVIEDNTNSIYLSRNKKSNITQFLEHYKNHNDSIYVWHHPILRDKYAKEGEINFRDSFIWPYIILRLFFFTIALLTIYLIIKKLLKK